MTQVHLQNKFQALEADLNGILFERYDEINSAVTAMVAKEHVFYIGPPGIAKSHLCRQLAKRIEGANYFSRLMGRFTTPEELFGPVSLTALEHDQYRRVTTNKLPEAHFAYITEIFKASSAILNTLLEILNERVFENDGETQNVPLATLFCDSNELPESEELAALWDRLLFRHETVPLQDKSSVISMLDMTVQKRLSHETVQPILTWDEVVQAQNEAQLVTVSNDVFEAMIELKDVLHEMGVEPTDRRWASSISVIQAAAWLNGHTEADVEDLRPLRHVLWYDVAHRKEVSRAVLQLVNPLDKAAQDALDTLAELEAELADAERKHGGADGNRQTLTRVAIEVHSKMKKLRSDIDQAKQKLGNRRSQTLDVLDERYGAFGKKLLTIISGSK